MVCDKFGIDEEQLYQRKRNSFVRPVAAKMLCKYAGLTQRGAAKVLNIQSGSAVSTQLRKLNRVVDDSPDIRDKVASIDDALNKKRC